MKFHFFVFFAALTAFHAFAAESEQMKQFVDWDVNHNKERGVKVDTDARPAEYFEIPLNDGKLVQHDNYMQWLRNEKGAHHGIIVDLAEYLPKEVRDVMVVEKFGVPHIRYFVSPTDTHFGKELQQYLTKRGILHRYYTADGEHKSEFLVRPTASRSMIIIDPKTDYSFSVKPSTNKSTARHTNDPNPTHWSYLNRRLSDYYYAHRGLLKNLDVAWEAGTIGFPNITEGDAKLPMQSQSIRLMDGVARGEVFHMSGFVLIDSPKEIERVAKLAGIETLEFRMQAQQIKGQAMAELSAILGWSFTSNHSQNFRWELDKNHRLTGRAVVLDLTDGHPNEVIFELNDQNKLLADWAELTKGGSKWNEINETNKIPLRSFWRDSNVSDVEIAAYRAGMRNRLQELIFDPQISGKGKDASLDLGENPAKSLAWRISCMNLGRQLLNAKL